MGEYGPPGEVFGRNPVDQSEVSERRALPVFRFLPNISLDFVTGPEVEFLDYPGAYIDVVLTRGIGSFPTPDKA